MKALIFAAGLGTRLKPYTDSMPKAMVPVNGKPLLEHIILKMKHSGFDELIVNVHHFPDQIIDFLKQNNDFGIRIAISDERDLLLDTGGGIKNASWFFDDAKPFLVHNVDIISNADFAALFAAHQQNNCLATLLVSKRDTFRLLLFDENYRLQGWLNEKSGETKPSGLSDYAHFQKLAFAGIQVLSPKVFRLMENFENRFPIMDFYISLAGTAKVAGYIPSEFTMLDIGKVDVLDGLENGSITLPG